MTEEKVYKCPDLDLKSLSERLQTPSYLVTKAINEGLGLNFYELINRYRVEEVKSLLINHDHKRFTLMAVAFDAGFNSKTTFNTVFKKMTGLTPSLYRSRNCIVSNLRDRCVINA
jgi:AraC-like DNA-binding protein